MESKIIKTINIDSGFFFFLACIISQHIFYRTNFWVISKFIYVFCYGVDCMYVYRKTSSKVELGFVISGVILSTNKINNESNNTITR